MNKLITVVMPVYNSEKYVEWAIKSVLRQTYTEWELIMVNDCSTDATPSILEQYKREYPNKIRIFSNEENRGAAYTLNRAISHARGEYICWLSSDDMYLDSMLEVSIAYLQEHQDKDAVFSKYVFINERNEVLSLCDENMYADCLPDDSHCVYERLLKYGNVFNGCSLFATSEAFRRTGEFSLRYEYASDYHYWVRFAALNQIGYADEFSVLSRQHPEQGTNKGQNDIDAIHVFADLTEDREIMELLCNKAGMDYTTESLSSCFISRIIACFQMGMTKELQEIVKCYSEWLNEHC